MIMKKTLFFLIIALFSMSIGAQENSLAKDSTMFKGYLYNQKYNVYIILDLYHKNVTVPQQEIYGVLPGYFGDKQDGRKWLFTNATIKGKTAELQIINDYGSEDLTATLTAINDSTYILRQINGSTIKIARNRKWVKMPKELNFIKR